MAIALRNTQRRMQIFNLRHDLYCEAAGRCGCTEQTVTTVEENPLTGERRPRSLKRKVAGALTLLALETHQGLHEAVLKLPEVKRAVDAGSLRVLTAPAQSKTASAPEMTSAPAPETKTRKEKDKERATEK